ncbi:MAG: PEGA domain-containing protein [Methanospirillum sp.]|nr:PEGA domain-containing protein [Methanospirillum sp.]
MPTSGVAPLTVQFTDTSTGHPTMWSWDFGDGTSQGMLANPSHTYQVPGTYTVKLTASSQTGTSTKVKEGFIQVSPSGGIVADFIGSPTCGNAPLTVQFSDRSQGRPTMWFWDFGDGGTALVGNPVHIYKNPGRYTVKLTSSNQASSNTAIKTDYIMVQSGPVGFGSIRIIYAPDRSSVYVDDVLKGETHFLQTFVVDNLQAGEHQIRISKPGFSDYVARVPVIYGHPTDVIADMRILPSQNGILSVYTYPVGSSVYIDGVLAGNGPLWKADVPPGVHQVKATSPGYLEWSQNVEVRGGGSVTYVTAALYPAWWTPIYGYIMVSSLPGNGAVFLDGVSQGHTPITLSQVPPGQHTIRIELPGYQPWQQAVNVMEGRTAYVLAQMTSGSGGGAVPVQPVVPTNPVNPTNPTNPITPPNPTNPTNPTNPSNPIIASAGGAEPAADQIIMASVPSADTSEATVQTSPAGSGDVAASPVPADIATGTADTTSTTGTEEYSVASAPADNASGVAGQAAPMQNTSGDAIVSVTSADNASGTPVQATLEQTTTEDVSGAVPTDNATGVPAMQTEAGQGIFSITSAPSDGNVSGGSPEQAGYSPIQTN